jgi:hypothetical protein
VEEVVHDADHLAVEPRHEPVQVFSAHEALPVFFGVAQPKSAPVRRLSEW